MNLHYSFNRAGMTEMGEAGARGGRAISSEEVARFFG